MKTKTKRKGRVSVAGILENVVSPEAMRAQFLRDGQAKPDNGNGAVSVLPVGMDAVTPDQHNANKGTARGRAMLESSVRQYGMGRSVLADKHGRLIAGNKTFEAASGAGITKAIVVPTDGTTMVVVQRTDLDLEVDVEAKALAIADNQTGAVGLAFDAPTLQELERQGVDMQQFFRPAEWSKLVDGLQTIDPAEEIPEMAIQPYEHLDYIMVVFRDCHAWTRACDQFGLARTKVTVAGGRAKIGLGRVITGERFFEVVDGLTATAKKQSS